MIEPPAGNVAKVNTLVAVMDTGPGAATAPKILALGKSVANLHTQLLAGTRSLYLGMWDGRQWTKAPDEHAENYDELTNTRQGCREA